MNDYDLIVLIPWGIFSIAFILLCVRLQISSRRSQRHPAPPARRAPAHGVEPADGQDAASPGQEPVPSGSQHRAAPSPATPPGSHRDACCELPHRNERQPVGWMP
jgi:hypothetical protein